MAAAEQITATSYLDLEAQQGPQSMFLSSEADIAIYGGAAGGGKSYGLLLEPLRHIDNPRFGCVIFRRNSTQIRNEGGLWHESIQIYGPIGARPREAFLEWIFPKGMRVKFGILEHEKSVYDWHGSQIPFIGFDELTTFTEKQFFYMLSRNRSTSGVPGYIRATCNPDVDSWVRRLIDWWIGPDGFPIQERAGKIRWFIRINNEMIWADSAEELKEKYGQDELPKSLTFIPSTIHDNKILLSKDPTYLANLRSLTHVERQRLLGGNWNIRLTAGTMFKQDWFPIINQIPKGFIAACRFWDRAGTRPHEGNKDPDWTRGLRLLKYPDGTFLVADLKSLRDTPGAVDKFIKSVAMYDGFETMICAQQDPGSAGVKEAEEFVKMLPQFETRTPTYNKDKITRARPVSSQAYHGNIFVLEAPWNYDFFQELENFPEGAHDDIVDALSGAYNELTGTESILNAL